MTAARFLLLGALLCAAKRAPAQSQTQTDQGRAVYEKWCLPCHYKVAQPELSLRTNLTVVAVRTTVRKGVNVMPRFRKTEISDMELDALVAYLTRKKAQ